jgi:hypothetical protein
MSRMSLVKAERARQNRAYVGGLLTQRQPEFAAALASAEQDLASQGPGLRQPLTCSLCNLSLRDAAPGTVIHPAEHQGADRPGMRGGMTGPGRGWARS